MKFLILLLLPLYVLSQDKGYIDMHGGKKDKLIQGQSNFSSFSSLGGSSLNKPIKKDEKKNKKPKKEKGYK